MASICSVPTSVTRAERCTGTTSPSVRPSAGNVISIGGSSSRSVFAPTSNVLPATSSRRVDDVKNRNRTGSPTTRPSSSRGSDAAVPSSMPNGATHNATTGGSNPGMAGAALSMPT